MDILFFLIKVEKLMRYLVLNFQTIDLKRKFFYEFLIQNNLHIFVIFMPFVKIRTLNALKKNFDNVFLIFFNRHCNNISEAFYYIFKLFRPNEYNFIDINRKKN